MTDWKGVNRKVSPVLPDLAVAEYQQNARLAVTGEAQRRYGMAKTTISQMGTAIISITPANPSMGPFVLLQGTDGGMDGGGGPVGPGGPGGGGGGAPAGGPAGTGTGPIGSEWGDVQLLPPTGTASNYSWEPGFPVDVSDSASSLFAAANANAFSINVPAGVYTLVIEGTVSYAANLTSHGRGCFFDITGNPDNVMSALTWNVSPSPTTSQTTDADGFHATQQDANPSDLTWTYSGTATITANGAGPIQVNSFIIDVDIGLDVATEFSCSVGIANGSGTDYLITVNRATDWDQFYLIFAREDHYPTGSAADEIFVGRVLISAGSGSTFTTWTPPNAGNWKFTAVAGFGAMLSEPGRLV